MIFPNVTLTSSKSGKLSMSHVKYYLQKVVKPNSDGDVLYLIDHWSGQTDESLYANLIDGHEIKLLMIPEGTTDLVQPLDLYFHRQLKYIVSRFYSHTKIHLPLDYDFLCSREGVVQMHSLVHFLLNSPKFLPMIKYSWHAAGLLNETPEFQNAKAVCFSETVVSCSNSDCSNIYFITCSWCDLAMCYYHFFHSYHFADCTNCSMLEKSP